MRSSAQRVLLFLFAGSLLLSFTGCVKPTGSLLAPAMFMGAPPPKDDVVVRSREVTVDTGKLVGPGNARLVLPLFDDAIFTIVLRRFERIDDLGYVWHGNILDEPGSTVTLAIKGKVVIGNIITQKGKFYQIRYVERGIHRIREIDASRIPPEGEPLEPKFSAEVQADSCATDPPSDIDVLVVYTAAARTGAGGMDAMEATVFLAVAETNQSYINSNINQRVRLAHVEEVSYTETGNSETDLNALQNAADGILDNVPTLRNTFAADTVVLITESLDYCGLSYQMETVSNMFESLAYAVVKRENCATGNYSFGHEMGHNMGARHDWVADSTNNSPYAYNHGHLMTAPTAAGTSPWRTIMSYNSSCQSQATVDCTRLQYWSNPFLSYPPGVTPNDPMGTSTGAQQTDNHRTLNNTASTVANFRCSSPGVANVWMKDTWNDTGREPDPATAAEDMWKSPYIWVRNSQDTGLTHQHQHQNPEFGSTNWVYVKLNNGATSAASGNLELYYANASVSLTWPAGWTLIGSTSVTGLAAHGTRVVEQEWTGLPGTGHYCLVARWISASDPMAVPEGADINANVRANNNLVWRNVDIIDLVGDESQDADFSVRNTSPKEERMVISLVVRGPRGGRLPSFLQNGEVFIQLDDKLMQAWKIGGGKGSGFIRTENELKISPEGARIDGLVLSPSVEGRVRIRFHRLPESPRRDFGLDIIQITGEKATGGVSYEIHTDRVE